MGEIDQSVGFQKPVPIATSEAMRRVLELAKRAAPSDATVLIQGDTGTGKEVIARTIHYHSSRSTGPFVAVNCGAYTDSLLASELFGHVRGAFTGASADRCGVFETANHGTVFLDEIGAMSPAMQVKMLRVLQERRVTRVGASKETAVDVRVIAATHSDLAEMTRNHSFREDLYYRIKVVTCRLPPLRDRSTDIKPLIEHFLDEFCGRFQKTGITISPQTEAMLVHYAWPGNVRQLRSEIEQIVAMVDSHTNVTPDDLSEDIRSANEEARIAAPAPPTKTAVSAVRHDATYQELIDGWTREVVAARLIRLNGNITKTAQSLAISRSTLYALLKKYGLHGQDE